MTPEDDSAELQALLGRMHGGDEEARGDMCRWVERRIRFKVRHGRRVNPRIARYEVTDDILQEILKRLVRSFFAIAAEMPANAGDFERWLATWTARNLGYVLVDIARRHYGPGDRKHVPGGLDHDDPALRVETGEERARRRQVRVHELIDELPEAERAVIDLRYYLNESKSEIARLLGIDRETVARRLSSAEMRLGRWIRAEDGDDFREFVG